MKTANQGRTSRKIRKVLLFLPPAFTFKDNLDINPLPPMGLAYLGAVLERAGIEVRIVDCLVDGWHHRQDVADNIIRIGLGFDRIEAIIRDYAPDMVGVNSQFTLQRHNAHQIYAAARRVDKGIVTVGGGAHPTVMPELVLADKNVDFAVLGEGEATIIDLINYLGGRGDIGNMDGLAYRDNGDIRIIPRTRFITDLDALPFPARHLLDMEKYFGLKSSHGTRRKRRFSPIVTSRGCPAKCTFCSAYRVWGRRFRYRSPENVIAEMQEIKERYGIEEIMFEDDNVTLNVNRAGRLFDLMISEKLDFVWDTPNGVAVYALNEALIDKMKASGCYSLNLALESGSQEVLDNIIKKPVRLPRAKELVRYAQNIGIKVKMYLIIGMPGETKEQMRANFRMAKELGIYTPFVSVATPYPGSELYDTCREKGYIPPDFSLDNLFIRSFSISTEDWTGADVREVLRQGYRMLLLANYRHHPLVFLRTVIKSLLSHPLRFMKQAYYFLMNKAVK